MKTSVFEIFKIGIGPSSSHTVGPMRAARDFVTRISEAGRLQHVSRLATELFGSLALTGRGHATDRAVILGLLGEAAAEIDPAKIESLVTEVRGTGILNLLHAHPVHFDEAHDLLFRTAETLPGHSNGMRFTAFAKDGSVVETQIYYSIGGGFINREGADSAPTPAAAKCEVPYPFSSAADLLRMGEESGMSIWEIALANEQAWRTETQIRELLSRIHLTMEACIDRGLRTEGILPGGLKVRRRAPRLFQKLSKQLSADPLAPMDWVNAFAMAVNEENAAGGRVVTAPTNGAAGIIPAVARYYLLFIPGATVEGVFRYLLTAGAIGILYKENASISGAEVGCQGEVGVACSMAAGGLAAALGGTNAQIEYAAEIGMEHNLGMTCDPIGGLVQIPCIERNAMGAVKAINAARMSLSETGEHKVSLDQVIETMYRTGQDMQSRYKETSLGGLALNIIEC
ncbi:MAG TPA: L-serine ammonia-lyase [Terriglobales bacterium]|nr:L-serine ammonia-lyase [Terriglobales bacterium]